MIKQGIILLAAAAACLALGDGRGYNSKKNTFQAPSQYASVAAFHGSKPSQAQPEPPRVPSPYAFGYEAEGSSRQESSDASGKVSGSYKVTNEDGTVRVVNYVADHNGFRANIDTNEPGTKSDNPADVTLKSSAVEKKYEAPTKYASPSYSSTETSMYEQKPIQFNMGSQRVKTNEFGTKSDSPTHVQFMSSAPQQGPAASSFRQTSSHRQQQQVTQYSAPAYQQAPIQVTQYSAPAYQQAPIQVEPAQSYQPSPYAFNYEAEASGGSSSRKESSDSSGTVTGSYEVRNADGSVRVVEYIADKDGFRANVKTNEQGTKSDNPADVTVKSDAPSAPVQVQQSPIQQANFPASTYTQKFNIVSQQHVDA